MSLRVVDDTSLQRAGDLSGRRGGKTPAELQAIKEGIAATILGGNHRPVQGRVECSRPRHLPQRAKKIAASWAIRSCGS